jgi:hypothetical protein
VSVMTHTRRRPEDPPKRSRFSPIEEISPFERGAPVLPTGKMSPLDGAPATPDERPFGDVGAQTPAGLPDPVAPVFESLRRRTRPDQPASIEPRQRRLRRLMLAGAVGAGLGALLDAPGLAIASSSAVQGLREGYDANAADMAARMRAYAEGLRETDAYNADLDNREVQARNAQRQDAYTFERTRAENDRVYGRTRTDALSDAGRERKQTLEDAERERRQQLDDEARERETDKADAVRDRTWEVEDREDNQADAWARLRHSEARADARARRRAGGSGGGRGGAAQAGINAAYEDALDQQEEIEDELDDIDRLLASRGTDRIRRRELEQRRTALMSERRQVRTQVRQYLSRMRTVPEDDGEDGGTPAAGRVRADRIERFLSYINNGSPRAALHLIEQNLQRGYFTEAEAEAAAVAYRTRRTR